MFDNQVGSKAKGIFGAIKTGSKLVGGALLEQGIENLGARSPLAAKIITKFQSNMQSAKDLHALRDRQATEFFKNAPEQTKNFADAVKKNTNKSDDKIDEEMKSILTKLRVMTDEAGKESTKQSELYKKYGDYFEEFMTSLQNNQTNNSETNNTTNVNAAKSDSGLDTKVFDDIESNTKKTAELLGKDGVPGKTTETKSVRETLQSTATDFISKVFDEKTIDRFSGKIKSMFGAKEETDVEPIKEETGVEPIKEKTAADVVNPIKTALLPAPQQTDTLVNIDVNTKQTAESLKAISDKKGSLGTGTAGSNSVKGALQNAGGAIVDKVFDEKTVDKLSDKVKSFFGAKKDTEEKTEEVEAEKNDDQILEELKKVNVNLIALNDTSEESSEKTAKVEPVLNEQKLPEPPTEKEKPTVQKSVLGKLKDKGLDFVKSRGMQLLSKAAGPIGTALSAGGGLLSTIGSIARPALMGLGSAGAGLLSTAGTAATGALSGLGAAASSIAAPVAGLAAAGIGGYQLGKRVISPLIDKGLSAVTGSDTSLGSYIYDKLHPETTSNVSAVKNNTGAVASIAPTKAAETAKINEMIKKNDAATESKAAKNSAPVIINNNSTSNSGGSGGKTIIASTSIRNQDSTFERVQMQDFWSRSFYG